MSSLFPELYKVLLEQLVLARRMAGLTQAEVAKSLNKPQSFVSKYESGERLLDMAEFVEIARILGSDARKMIKKTEA